MRTSRTRTASVNTMRSGYRYVSATDTLMTRHAPLKMTASQTRPVRARMNEPMNVAHHTDAARKRTNTVGSLAASPARTCVIQLFTRIARCVSFSLKVAPAVDANVVDRMIATHQNCSLMSTQSACCSESGYIDTTTR